MINNSQEYQQHDGVVRFPIFQAMLTQAIAKMDVTKRHQNIYHNEIDVNNHCK